MKFEHIEFCQLIDTWENAVKKVAKPLLEKNYIELSYEDAMIKNIQSNGSYMILMPGVIMPHSRPEDGVNRTSTTMLVLGEEVAFPDDNNIWLVICLAAKDSEAHIDTIETLSELLLDEEKLEAIKNAGTTEKIKEILNH